jgi:hypothetical protein
MLEEKVRLASESLARSINRRRFLKWSGAIIFGGLAAVAAGQMTVGRASARRLPPPDISCSPPGPYCNTGGGDLSGCHGASCFQHLSGQIRACHVVYYWYQAGCWTTSSGGGYWTCCDCQCDDGSFCGCAQFSNSPAPRPDGPTGKSDA